MVRVFLIALLCFIGSAQSAVLYEQTYTGVDYDISQDAGFGYGYYVLLPLWSGSGDRFPGTGGITLSKDIHYLRLIISEQSDIQCSDPIRVDIFDPSGVSAIASSLYGGVKNGKYCDYPFNAVGTEGMNFWSVIICTGGGSCGRAEDGALILDGSPNNPGYASDGTLQANLKGGWAFQLCDIDGCDEFGKQTPTGFYWPTGVSGPSNYANFLAMGCYGNTDYLEDRYHIGKDIEASVGTPVIAISDGEVESVSYNGWGTGNVALVVRHWLFNGISFYALYGHVHSNLQPGSQVSAGDEIATIGPYGLEPHLHFGINTESKFPNKNYGIMPCKKWPDNNGFIEPINWITTQKPGVDLSGGQ